jgi:hypothetical protein
MEHRGVLVAIAGRRDGVRVYALEEVKRAVEWRVEMEVKREHERNRREEVKRATLSSLDKKSAAEKNGSNRTRPSGAKSKPDRRATVSVGSPTTRARTPSPVRKRPQTPPISSIPVGPPPAYTPPLHNYANSSSFNEPPPERIRTTSVSDVLAGTARPKLHHEGHNGSKDVKEDWDSSDDEAIDLLAAPSGSQALDERTSAAVTAPIAPAPSSAQTDVAALPRTSSSSAGTTRHRPANLDLSLTRANPPNTVIATGAPPSPTPTLLTLRQALMASPGNNLSVPTRNVLDARVDNGSVEADDDEEVPPSSPTTPTRERISLAEALLESRLPDLPPAGTRRPQTAVLLGSSSVDEEQAASPRTSESFSTRTRQSIGEASARRRRRWSVFDGIFPQPGSPPPMPATVPGRMNSDVSDHALSSQPEMRQRQSSVLSRSQSTRLVNSRIPGASNADVPTRPSTAGGEEFGMLSSEPPVESPAATPISPEPPSVPAHGSRFLPRIITNAFNPRRSDDRPGTPKMADYDGRKSIGTHLNAQAPAPKLEYVKLPGTKGSVMVKAVETAKKRFVYPRH